MIQQAFAALALADQYNVMINTYEYRTLCSLCATQYDIVYNISPTIRTTQSSSEDLCPSFTTYEFAIHRLPLHVHVPNGISIFIQQLCAGICKGSKAYVSSTGTLWPGQPTTNRIKHLTILTKSCASCPQTYKQPSLPKKMKLITSLFV